MTTLDDAKTAWKAKQKQFRKNTPTRTAYLGDGQGFATSNIVVADNPTMFYARDNLTVKDYFVVPNFNSNINPQFNLPVVLGYDQTNPNVEQILGVDMSVFPYQSSASVLGGLGPHHRQHEFGGGDEVFIDPELIKVGLFTPNAPADYQGWIQPFYYSHKTSGLKLFSGSMTESLQSYKPSTSGITRLIAISFNPDAGNLVYRQGDDIVPVSESATLEELLDGGGSIIVPGGSAAFPAIPGGEIPLATFFLTSTTASLNWSAASSSYYHSRLFLGKVDTDIYTRLDALESKIGLNTLPTTGATKRALFENKNVHDGDFRIGRINDQQTSGSSPSWGNKLYFSGALGTGSWNSENSDPQWMARYNSDDNVSYLRMSIGDDSASNVDAFQIGTTSLGDAYTPLYSFYSNGEFIVPAYTRHVQIGARLTGNPANQPTEVDFFTVSGLQFATTGAKYAFCQWEIPDDWNGADIYFEVDWFPDSAAMAGTDTVEWTVEYACVAEGEIHGAGVSKTLTVTNSNDNARYFSVHSRGTMPYNDANQPLSKQDHVYFKISRNTAVANDFGGTVTVPAFEIIYNSTTIPTGN